MKIAIMADSARHQVLPPEVLGELDKAIEATDAVFDKLEPVGDAYSAADQMMLEVSARMNLLRKYVKDYMASQE